MPEITDIRAYATLETDNLPRLLVRDSSNRIFIDSGQVGTLSGSSEGACMIPYRPNQSPQAFMYVAGAEDYKKYSAPDIVTQGVLEFEVGIEEQQDAPEACTDDMEYTSYTPPAFLWVLGGTASGASNTTRVTDTAGSVLEDPVVSTPNRRCSVQVTNLDNYQLFQPLSVGGVKDVMVQFLYPAINGGAPIAIESIVYFSGTSGDCVIVPIQSPVSAAFQVEGTAPSPYVTTPLSGLSRGSLVQLSGGAGTEIVYVLSATVGPNGTVCFECTTTLNFVAGDTITGIPAFAVNGLDTSDSGASISCSDITYSQTGAGIGTADLNLSTSPFNVISSDGLSVTQQYDYLGLPINISDLSLLVAITFIFNINPTNNFTEDGFYFQVDPSQLIAHPSAQSQFDAAVAQLAAQADAGIITWRQFNEQRAALITNLSILPASQYTTLFIPITQLKRFGGNTGFTLSDCNGFRIQIETTGSITVRTGPQTIGIGNQPDIGPAGSPYFYAVRTRNPITGNASNPSPVTRYGLSSRRQSNTVQMQDSNSDVQDTMWDIYRMGGGVTQLRYLASIPNTGGLDTFTDNYFDTAALGGSVIEYDNFQPWPTIDVPFNVAAGGGSGITILIQNIGTVILLTYYSASAFTDPTPATILRWLPGTLITLDGSNAYTLWNRPVAFTLASPPAAHYFCFMFRTVENTGSGTPGMLNINEPLVANQDLPYLWGPDAEGTVFGAGDPLRPGNVYFCKSFTPDSAPDTYNQEITNPSEPLMGGEIINGLALVASTKRWWALYPNFGSGNRYQAVEAPVPRGSIAPYAHATDNEVVYFWAKDGIWTTSGQCLTDADLWNIFPHEGVVGQDYVYGGQTFKAPDYKYAALFRLCYRNFYLYADYRDSDGVPRTMVCDLRDRANPAWCVDEYADRMCCHYSVEQQAGTLLDTSALYSALVMGDENGKVHVQRDLTNDNGTPINAVVATFEFNGGDVRSNELYNDQFLDLVPAAVAGVNATILDGGVAAQAVFVIPTSTSRQHTNVPIGLELSYMGVLLEWTDDFDQQSVATLLRSWQPMFQSVPISLTLWKNQGTAFGLSGYKHIPWLLIAYRASAPVTLTITVYDGTAPAVLTLPSTGGAYQKTLFWLTFNKAMLYFIQAECDDAEWQLYLSDSEIPVGAWNRGDPYTIVRDIPTALGVGEG